MKKSKTLHAFVKMPFMTHPDSIDFDSLKSIRRSFQQECYSNVCNKKRNNLQLVSSSLKLLQKKLGHATLVGSNSTSISSSTRTPTYIYTHPFPSRRSRPSHLSKEKRCLELPFSSFIVCPLSDPSRSNRVRTRDTSMGNATSFEALTSLTRNISRKPVRRALSGD